MVNTLLKSFSSSTNFGLALRGNKGSLSEVFYKNSVFKSFTKFIGKHLRQSLFCNKVADLRPDNFIKNENSGTDNTSTKKLLLFSCFTLIICLYKIGKQPL